MTNTRLAGIDLSVAETTGANIDEASWDDRERKHKNTYHHWVSWAGN